MLRSRLLRALESSSLSRPLSSPKLTQALALELPGWSASSSHQPHIRREFLFPDFQTALGFMHRVGETCDSMNHHPRWCNTYNRVEVELCTHDAGNQVTGLDVQLAACMNKVYEQMKSENWK